MGHGPSLVIRGAILGCLSLALFSLWVTSGVSPSQAAPGIPASTQAPSVQELSAEQAPASLKEPSTPAATCGVSQRYPAEILQWCGLITQYAAEFNLDADLIAALIWQESGGAPGAFSRSGAVGLMQVMPRDGIAASFMCKNGPCFSKRPTIQELNDPEFNIHYGTRMLAGLLNYHGSLREALKAYGPMDSGYSYADKVLGISQRYGE